MKVKSETMKHVKYFFFLIKTQFQKTIKTIRTVDNGPKFLLKYFYMEHGIHHQTTGIHTLIKLG